MAMAMANMVQIEPEATGLVVAAPAEAATEEATAALVKETLADAVKAAHIASPIAC